MTEGRQQEQQTATSGEVRRPIVFSSRLGMLLTMVGVAVGLGNVWRFPYMMGSYGGSAFLIVYLCFALLLAAPALSAEWALGRLLGAGPPAAYIHAFGPRLGLAAGGLLFMTVLVADSYYLVVIAQILLTGGFALYPGFTAGDEAAFRTLLASGTMQYVVALALLLFSLWVIGRGLNRGIERLSRLVMPGFALVMLYLIFNALALPGAFAALGTFLRPDFSALSARDVFAALGQAFFSLGLGGTFHVVYGSYLAAGQRLPGAALATALGDTTAALLATLFIVPTALVIGLDLAQGPGLIFSTLPHLFARLPAGGWLGAAFLFALAGVALLSNIAALEVAAAALRRMHPKQQTRILAAIFAIEAVLILPSAYDNDLIGLIDLIFGSGMQVTGSLLALIALGWAIGRERAAAALFGPRPNRWQRGYTAWIRWAVPLALAVILSGWLGEQTGH